MKSQKLPYSYKLYKRNQRYFNNGKAILARYQKEVQNIG